MRQGDDQSAVLVIRAWHEEGSPPGAVRARLTESLDGEAQAVDGEEAIVDAVRAWLRAITQR